MKLSIPFLVVTIVLIGLAGWLVFRVPELPGNVIGYSDLIQVDTPTPGATIASPLTVTGKARGSWYFEASFPVKLMDANGKELAVVPAQAQGDWMTEEFVPFKATLTFAQPATEMGVLILKNDNPSGDPLNNKQITIPVRFAPPSTATSTPATSTANKFGKPVTLRVGETARFPDGLTVYLKQIDDSRCKPGVQCIWAGELSPLLIASDNKLNALSGEVRLGTVNNKTATVKGYQFVLQSATATSATIIVSPAVVSSTGISGYVHTGPTCPVMRTPPDPQCDDRPYAVGIEIHAADERLITTLQSGADGYFFIALASGAYIVRPIAANVLPRCEEKRVTVTAGSVTAVDISCDSGIR